MKFFSEKLFDWFFFYLTIGNAMKNETSHTRTIIMATRFEFLWRAYLSGFVTAI
jgi:hypothetical protein